MGNASLFNAVISLDQARLYIDELDLTYIIRAMCATDYPLPRWTVEDATHCCQLYKNFLILYKKHFPLSLVPTREVDEFWHNHILYTKNYFQDCEKIFGHYLHHQPADPTENIDILVDAFEITKKLYFAEFNEPLVLMGTTT